MLKSPFKFLPDIFRAQPGGWAYDRVKPALNGRPRKGRGEMARFEIMDVESASLGNAPATADTFYELGMMYSVGHSVPIDFITAHKWFNIAAMRGNSDAIRLRREIAEQMSDGEIAQAQRAARAWLIAMR